ncbi:unnamed protein product [Trichobilharzia szidati]|nr:unnamed protein product [Trichobilharzia szidati]
MKPDILLPRSFIRKNQLHVFQVVVINDKFPATIGVSSSDEVEIPDATISRFGANLSEKLTVQLPARVFPAKLLKLEIITPVNPLLIPLLETSVHYRLQMSHLLIGTTEIVRALGDYFSLQCIEAISTTGESIFIRNARQQYNTNDSWSCEFNQSVSNHLVFKIGTSTQLILVQTRNLPSLSVDMGSSITSRLTAKDDYTNHDKYHLCGLDVVKSVVFGYLQNFLLTCVEGNKTVLTATIEAGIIIYGLPGCGKRTFLESLTDGVNYADSDIEPHKSLTFITLTSKLIKELTDESSHRLSIIERIGAHHWLKNSVKQSEINGKVYIPVVILWPNIDKWIDSDENGDGNYHTSAVDTNSEVKKFSVVLDRLMESIQCVNQTPVFDQQIIYRFCILATATTIDKVFSIHECRELFYRRLLVSLPDATRRYQILYHNIYLRLHHDKEIVKHEPFSEDSTMNDQSYNTVDENENLIQVAAQLHGYTPKDLVRLVQVTYASFVATQHNCLEDSVKRKVLTFNEQLDLFCRILRIESRSYLPINISHHITSVDPLRWTDIGGYSELKLIFRTMIQDRLISAAKPNSPEAKADAALLLRVPRGILLHGPPGCSKTMFVRALATECQLPLIAVQASRIFGRYVGDSERNMRRILVQARASAPAILFIDEIDLLLPSRNSGETSASEHVLGEVLMAMDGVEGQNGQVILVAATNRMDKLDSALSRAGRFDLVIEVPPPDATARLDILRLELSKRALENESLVECKWLNSFAENEMNNYTGAEVVQIVQQAAQLARQDGSNRISKQHLKEAKILLPPRSLFNYSNQNGKISKQFNAEVTNRFVNFRFLLLISFIVVLFAMLLHFAYYNIYGVL